MPSKLQKIFPNMWLFNRVNQPHPKKSIKNIKKTIDNFDNITIMDSMRNTSLNYNISNPTSVGAGDIIVGTLPPTNNNNGGKSNNMKNNVKKIVFSDFENFNNWLKQNNGKNIGYAVLENNDGTTTYIGTINLN